MTGKFVTQNDRHNMTPTTPSTAPFKEGDLVRTKPMKVIGKWTDEHFGNEYLRLDDGDGSWSVLSKNFEPVPAPLLPSSDEVGKLLERLDKVDELVGAYSKQACWDAARVIRSLQSELASLRAQGDAEWNAARRALGDQSKGVFIPFQDTQWEK